MIDFSIVIQRERLRPKYGDGFKGAPLETSLYSQRADDQHRGVDRDEPERTQRMDCASDI
jgi:hypothetical protein